MSGFEHNNFLTGSISDADIQIQEILDSYFRKDGSIPMTGTFNAGSQSLFAIKDAELNYSLQVVPPAGKLSLYSKADDHLYTSTSGGVESQLSSGGDVDGPASAVDSNLASYDGVTGKIIKDSLIPQANVVTAASNFDNAGILFSSGTSRTVETDPDIFTTANTLNANQCRVSNNIQFEDSGGTNAVFMQSANTLAASYVLTLPIDDGASGETLRTDGNGALSWVDRVAGPGSSTNNNLCSFNGTTGLLIKDSGLLSTNIVTSTTGSNDNRLARYDGATGKVVQNSLLGCNDLGDLTLSGGTYMSVGLGGENMHVGLLNAIGGLAGAFNNTSIGHQSLEALTDGDSNTGCGRQSGQRITTGSNNTSIGADSHLNLVSGDDNIAVGWNAGSNITTNDSDTILIGHTGVVGDNNVIRLGTTQTSTLIQGIHSVTPSGAAQMVIIDSTGEMGSSLAAADVVTNSGTGMMDHIAVFDGASGKIIKNSPVELNSAGVISGVSTLDITHTATESDDHALDIVCNTANFGDVKALNIIYDLGTIGAGIDEEGVFINVDETVSTGGRFVGLEVVATDQGSAEIDAVEVGAGVHPLLQESGTFGNASLIVDSVLGDIRLSVSDPPTSPDPAIFVLDNSSLIIGNATQFTEMEFIFDTPASGAGIAPVFEFSDSATPTWTVFSPGDGTNGMMNNGIIIWELTDIPGWTAAAGDFQIRITRTRNTLTTTPLLMLLQVATTVSYHWDKNADLLINNIAFTGSGSGTISTTENIAEAIYLHANGGVAETIKIHADQGTSATSIDIVSDVGGISMFASEKIEIQTDVVDTKDGINIIASTSPIDISTGEALKLFSSSTGIAAISINATDSAGGLIMSSGTFGSDINSTGPINIVSTFNNVSTDAILIETDGGVNDVIALHADQGTGVDSINLLSDVGGIRMVCGRSISTAMHLEASGAAGGVTVSSGTSGTNFDTTGPINLVSTENAAEAILLHANGSTASTIKIHADTGTAVGDAASILLHSDVGGVTIRGGVNAAESIYLHSQSGTSETIRIHNDAGTGSSSIQLDSDVGGIEIKASASTLVNSIKLDSLFGGIDVDCALKLDIAAASATADAIRIDATDAAGGVEIEAGTGGVEINSTATATALGFFKTPIAQVTTGVSEATFVENAGGAVVNVDSTAGGYTFQQVVLALQNYGLLA